MHSTSLSTLFAIALLTFVTVSEAVLPGTWPPIDQPPPMKPEWEKLVDRKKIPKAPVQTTQAGDCSKAAQFCYWSCNNCVRNASDVVTCPNDKDWAVSYDDGPSDYTAALLDFLKSTGTKATFAVVGSRVYERPELVQRMKDEGHEIVVHTWSHPALATVSTERIIAEVKWTEEAIKAAVGLTPKFMRPPRGDYDDRVRNIVTQLGYKILLWDRDTFDWMSNDDPNFRPEWITGNFSKWVTDDTKGHMSLEHDLYKIGAENAPAAIKILRDNGYTIKPVSVCTGMPAYVENVQLAASATGPISLPAAASNTTSPSNTTDGSASAASYDTSDSNVSYQFSSFISLFILTISIAVFTL
jgi:peptidoglycan/xylan/chitin deacetylase (PgdA/CDA1 family)